MTMFKPFQRVQLRITGEKPRTIYGYVLRIDRWDGGLLVHFDDGIFWISDLAVHPAPISRRRARGLRP